MNERITVTEIIRLKVFVGRHRTTSPMIMSLNQESRVKKRQRTVAYLIIRE